MWKAGIGAIFAPTGAELPAFEPYRDRQDQRDI